MQADLVWLVIAGLLSVTGLAGTILPGLPGVPLVSAAIILYGYGTDFVLVDPWMIAMAIIFALIALLADYLTTIMTMRKAKGSSSGIWGAVLGMIAGGIVLSIPGALAGLMLGAFLGELTAGRPLALAFKLSLRGLAGLALGAIGQFILAVILITIFVLRVL